MFCVAEPWRKGECISPAQVKFTGTPCGLTHGEQVIGTKFVLYRETHSKKKDKRVKLMK